MARKTLKMTMSKRFFRKICAILTVGFTLFACTPTIDYRGYLLHPRDIAKIHTGLTKTQVLSLLGSPSTIGMVKNQGDKFYYISSVVESEAFFRPKVIDRKILAIHFDREDRVDGFATYGLENGQIVNFSSRETPVNDKGLSILQELFRNVGQFGAGGPASAP